MEHGRKSWRPEEGYGRRIHLVAKGAVDGHIMKDS